MPLYNHSPTAKIKPDGTFSRTESFTIQYTDGSSERYRVSFKGRFLADGVIGTLARPDAGPQEGQALLPVRQQDPDLGGTP